MKAININIMKAIHALALTGVSLKSDSLSVLVGIVVIFTGVMAVSSITQAQASTYLQEDFSTSQLDPAWTVTDTYPGHGNYSLTGNSLRYYLEAWSQSGINTPTPPNEWGYVYYPSMNLSRSFSGTDWTFETKVTYYMPWSNGRGLSMKVCFGSNTNSITFGRGADQSGGGASADKMSWGATIDGITQQGELPITHTYYDTYYFRILRKDKEVTLLWSANGQYWLSLYNTRMSDQTAGLSQYVLLGGDSWATPAGSYADYDYIYVTPRPWLTIRVKTVELTLHVTPTKTYQLESSFDLNQWANVGQPFIATSTAVTYIFDTMEIGRYFKINEVLP